MTKLVVITGFVVAFVAGLLVGIESQQTSVASPSPTPATRPSNRHGGWMASELNLTPQQQEQLDKIWSETARSRMHEADDRRHELRTQRDDAILSLIPAEKKADYDAAIAKYKEQTSALDHEMKQNFDEAVRRTKEILTPEQRPKYEEWLSRHQPGDRGPRGGPGGPGDRGHDRSHPTTQP